MALNLSDGVVGTVTSVIPLYELAVPDALRPHNDPPFNGSLINLKLSVASRLAIKQDGTCAISLNQTEGHGLNADRQFCLGSHLF